MTLIDTRCVFAAAAALAAGAFGAAGVANAEPGSFNVDGYSSCTAAPPPSDNPDEQTDFVVSCCVQNAGVAADTSYGMGCVSPAATQGPDDHPTIVLPTRPLPVPDDTESLLLP